MMMEQGYERFPSEAYKAGYDAYWFDIFSYKESVAKNPYEKNTAEYAEWQAGYAYGVYDNQ